MDNNISHPSHYNREGALECIEEMELVFGREAVKNFCLLNTWKYRYRAADKNGIEDLKKSDWYLKKYKELDGKKETITIKKDDSIDPGFYQQLKKIPATEPITIKENPSNPYYPITPWDQTWYGSRPWWDTVTCHAINAATNSPGKSE